MAVGLRSALVPIMSATKKQTLPVALVDCPTLLSLVAQGHVEYDSECELWFCRAADGVECSLGSDLEGIERYLVANPNPTNW